MQHTVIENLTARLRTRFEEPDLPARLIAVLAVLAWLVLAGEALAEGGNRWAPAPVAPRPPAPETNAQVWGSGSQAGSVYAPADLEQRLAAGTAAVDGAPAAAGTAKAAPQVAPVYAPAGTAVSSLPPQAVQPPAPVLPQTAMPPGYGAAPVTPYYGNGYAGYPSYSSYPSYLAAGPGGLPGLPYGAAPLPGIVGQPYGYGLPAGGYPAGGYFGAAPYGGYPYTGVYPGIVPGLGGWGGPWGGAGTAPFFGGSPFGFW